MKTVKDVMSAPPVSVSETASFRGIVARLRECRFSAFPVVDADGTVIGVVSEADLLAKEALADEPSVIWGLLAGLVHHAARAKAAGVTASDLMTSPAVTIGPDDTVEHAARLMGAVEALREAPGLSGPDWWRRPRERMGEAVRAAKSPWCRARLPAPIRALPRSALRASAAGSASTPARCSRPSVR